MGRALPVRSGIGLHAVCAATCGSVISCANADSEFRPAISDRFGPGMQEVCGWGLLARKRTASIEVSGVLCSTAADARINGAVTAMACANRAAAQTANNGTKAAVGHHVRGMRCTAS